MLDNKQQSTDNLTAVSIIDLYGAHVLKEQFHNLENRSLDTGFHHIDIDNPFIKGELKYAHLNNITITYQDWELLQPFKLQIEHEEELMKIQFELEGGSLFISNTSSSIPIRSRHYQFIHIPNAIGHITYLKSRSVLDIHFKLQFLLDFLKSQGFEDQKIQDHFVLNNWIYFITDKLINPNQESIIQDIIKHEHKNDFAIDFLTCRTMELLLSVFSAPTENSLKQKWRCSDLQIVHQVKQFLEENYHTEIHFQTLTRQFGINEFKLKNIFKDVYGETVFTYIRSLRLNKAYKLLQETSLQIKEITFLCGFKYAHHFSKAFFNHFQILPRDIRKT